MRRQAGDVVVGCRWMLALFLLVGASQQEAFARDGDLVNCDDGQSLAQAVHAANPGDTVRFTGTCNEPVVLTKDDFTIEGQSKGQSKAVIDAQSEEVAALTIDGARRVIVKNVTVQNSRDGLLADGGATVTLDQITAKNNHRNGIQILRNSVAQITGCQAMDNANSGVVINQGSTADITDCTSQNNGNDGLALLQTSSAVLRGAITFTGCTDDGINVFATSSLRTIDATIIVDNNGDDGLAVVFSSSAFIQRGSVSANRNGQVEQGGDGIHVTTSAHLNANDCAVTANGNADDGLLASLNGSLAFVGGTITTEGNGQDGIVSGSSASVFTSPNAPLTARNNGRYGVVTFIGASETYLGDIIAEGNPMGDRVNFNLERPQ